ncbi:laccase 9 [Coprinopsis marcescibilis]|uniref:Laccase 9 n=1 Tax=Coprinopsis marcescibilis TaxID=230819 RepID=A0A5C3KY69_COPMA|nr:laccase 9 [Coprinopsis marcescibilis]
MMLLSPMFRQLVTLAALAASSVPVFVVAQSMGPVGDMRVSNIRAAPDGFDRPVVGVNGQFPAPLITAQKGANFQINLVNDLDDTTMLRQTSVHWHGVFQKGTPWMDGPEGVTQCPLPQNGATFRYDFTAGQEAGTYWYHSHYKTQYCDGLRGPIVIYDDDDPHKARYNVDDETTVITLADWYHRQAPSIRGAALSDATLINGKGRDPLRPDVGEIHTVGVEATQRYRLRIVSMSCDPDYTFSIDNHNLTIIEADGQPTEPLTVQELRIFAGQRYSVVLEANAAVGSAHWIRAIPNIGRGQLPRISGGGVNSAILRYADPANPNDTKLPETSAATNPIKLAEKNLRALLNPAAPGGSAEADIVVPIKMSFTGGLWRIDGQSWPHQEEPIMVKLMNNVPPSDLGLPNELMKVLPKGKVVEIRVEALSTGGPHPFHLHGHAFSVIKSANEPADTANFVNPVRRDVVSTGLTAAGGDGVTIIRFTTDNPGPWFFHCHIEFHLDGGLGMVFLEAPEDISRPPTEWNKLCEDFKKLTPAETSVSLVARSLPTPGAHALP